jgi:hypothetical protein
MNKISTHPLFIKLATLQLPSKDFAIFGSAPMWLHGLKELGNDIDLVVRGEAWEKAKQLGEIIPAPTTGNVIKLFGGEIEIYDSWGPGEWDANELIDNALEVEGIKFVDLADVARWKEIYGREKDLQHLDIIKRYLSS